MWGRIVNLLAILLMTEGLSRVENYGSMLEYQEGPMFFL